MFEGKVILVVDDEADLREILRDELAYEGAQVFEAANGKEALRQLLQTSVDLVLSDIRMPGGDGATLTKEIRKSHSSKPLVILITGFADLHTEDAYALGADGYVTKPFHLEDLKNKLKRLLSPPKQRWLSSREVPGARVLSLPSTLEEAVQNNILRMGRGGFCLKVEPENFRLGDFVEVRFQDALSILGQIQWVRSEPAEERPKGMGLEFWKLSEDAYQRIQKAVPDWESTASFIPNC